MNIPQYLQRINFTDEPKVDLPTLKALHRQHVLHIPFECLDIHLGRPLHLTIPHLFQKVIEKRRGGFCYELNYLFYNLLTELGFSCRIIAAQVYSEQGVPGPKYDHLAIIVDFEGEWLADVGFGDYFIEPMPIGDLVVHQDWFKTYQMRRLDEENFLTEELRPEEDNKPLYNFSRAPQNIKAFVPECYEKQHLPDSHFIRNRICTRATPTGRITLRNEQMIERVDGQRTETVITSDEEYYRLAEERFGMDLEREGKIG